MIPSDDFSLDRISMIRFRPTKEADEFLTFLRNTLIPGERYLGARLAIARSLAEQSQPNLVPKGTETGSAIEGAHLFQADKSIWAVLLTQAWREPIETAEQFRAVVEAHWHRGADLLRRDWESARENETEFALELSQLAGPSTRAPRPEGTSADIGGGAIERIAVRFGEVGIEQRSNSPVEIVLNGPGTSPHIALMGKTRSGKTRTGIVMAERIASTARVPVLFIDPKGDFVRDGKLVAVPEWGGRTLADRFPGIEALDVPNKPVPLDFLALPDGISGTAVAEIAIQFRDSFKKCIKSKGDVALDTLRATVDDLLHDKQQKLSLDEIRDAVHHANMRAGKKKDTIEAKLNELTSLRLFEPTHSPRDFFRRSWAVGLNRAGDESKRLVMFLLLDALANYTLSQPNGQTDSAGHRQVRHLLVVDEALEILRYRHAALSRLIRQSASKGEIIVLLSQSPDDFDQEEDDFLAQVGTVGVFASSARTVAGLSAAFGQKMRPEDFSDGELPRGVAFTKLPHRDPQKVIAWR